MTLNLDNQKPNPGFDARAREYFLRYSNGLPEDQRNAKTIAYGPEMISTGDIARELLQEPNTERALFIARMMLRTADARRA